MTGILHITRTSPESPVNLPSDNFAHSPSQAPAQNRHFVPIYMRLPVTFGHFRSLVHLILSRQTSSLVCHTVTVSRSLSLALISSGHLGRSGSSIPVPLSLQKVEMKPLPWTILRPVPAVLSASSQPHTPVLDVHRSQLSGRLGRHLRLAEEVQHPHPVGPAEAGDPDVADGGGVRAGRVPLLQTPLLRVQPGRALTAGLSEPES